MISIVIPTFNEESVIEETLVRLADRRREEDFELIVSDGQSTDATVMLASRHARVVSSERGRSRQLNRGADEARGDVLFFLHADAELPPGALIAIRRKLDEGYDGGGFSNVFASHNRRIKLLGRILNLRLRDNDHAGNTRFFGDNGIFVRTPVFRTLSGFRDMESDRTRRGRRLLPPRVEDLSSRTLRGASLERADDIRCHARAPRGASTPSRRPGALVRRRPTGGPRPPAIDACARRGRGARNRGISRGGVTTTRACAAPYFHFRFAKTSSRGVSTRWLV